MCRNIELELINFAALAIELALAKPPIYIVAAVSMATSLPPVVRIDGKEWMLPVEVSFRMVLVSINIHTRVARP